MKKGFTLLEAMVVVSIIAILSFMGINSVNSFRQEAIMDNTVNEFISVLKTARNKSMAGEIPDGMTSDTSKFSEDGLPVYGVEVNSGTYYLTRNYTYDGTTTKECQTYDGNWISDCTTYLVVPSEFSITPGVVKYLRISGKTISTNFDIKKVSSGTGKKIEVSSDGMITISEI